MPRRTKPNDDNRFSQFRTVYLDFNDNERAEIVQLIDSGGDIISGELYERCEDGWKISISYSASWGNYVCSITPKEVPEYEAGRVFIFRHEDSSRIDGFLRFFFSVMVPNHDARLQGEERIDRW